MKLLTYVRNGEYRLGVLQEEQVVDVAQLARATGASLETSMLDLIDAGPEGLQALADALAHEGGRSAKAASLPAAQVEFAAPIPRPRKNIFGVGLNYHSHVDEASRVLDTAKEAPKEPVYFTKAPMAVVAPGGSILHHRDVTQQLDWEAELAVVIGRKGKRVPESEAMSYVFGYSCMNDISARDCRRAGQWFLAKGQDGSAPFGPVLVTADEIEDPHNLKIELLVNGQTKQSSNTSFMIFKIPTLIADLSRAITLEPGDIIATGTPSGVGISYSPPQFLKAGDTVEMRIDKIGTLRNTVANA